ncbi:MAG TPA: hypothetical protein VGN52_00270 [Burkholderiales bacterium]
MDRIVFVAMLYLGAAACLLLGSGAAYERIEYRLYAEPATMELADPAKKLVVPEGGYDLTMADVRYVSGASSVVVPQKVLAGPIARQLAAGQKIALFYYTNDPHRVRYPGDELPMPWGWLAGGAVLAGLGAYAHRLLRREGA